MSKGYIDDFVELFYVSVLFIILHCCQQHFLCFLISSLSSCRGVGGGEGEPHRDRANRKTETPASPQRTFPLQTVRESTCDTYQVLNTSSYTKCCVQLTVCRRCQWVGHEHITSTAHFLLSVFYMVRASLSPFLSGESAVSHY